MLHPAPCIPPVDFRFRWTPASGMERTMDRSAGSGTGSESGQLVALLDAVSRGDRNAFSALYECTSAKLYGICLRLLGSEAEAQDVLQEAYVTVWRNAARFDPGRASPITWLAVVVRNKAIDRLRRRTPATGRLDEAADVADESDSAFDLLERSEEAGRLARCMGELDEQPRAMIRAAFIEGATYPELAEREGVPLGTMKSWIRRGLLRLRGCLER